MAMKNPGFGVRLFLFALCFLALPVQAAKSVEIQGARLWNAPDHTRLVFDISRSVEHRLFTLENPSRLVIDFEDASLKKKLDPAKFTSRHIKTLRYAPQPGGKLRVVLDLAHPVRPRSFLLRPSGDYGHRLVIDLYDRTGSTRATQSVKKEQRKPGVRDVIVAIDAGHGGEDPGARRTRHARRAHAQGRLLRRVTQANADRTQVSC